MKTTCHACQSPIKDGMNRCPNCGKWNFFDSGTKDRRTILSKVKPDSTERLRGGPWDPCFGGGIMTSSVTLLAGEPGAGKSTLLLQMSDSVAAYCRDTSYRCVYIATEENEEQIKERADRLQLQNQDYILLVNAMGGMNLAKLLEETKPYFVILDSLPGFTGKGTNKDEALQVIKVLKFYAEKNHAPAIVTDHITKDADFAGYMSLMHAVDCLLMFKKEKEQREYRRLSADKNRNGALKDAVFTMTERGLIPGLQPFPGLQPSVY